MYSKDGKSGVGDARVVEVDAARDTDCQCAGYLPGEAVDVPSFGVVWPFP